MTVATRIVQRIQVFSQKRPLLFNSVMYGSFYTGAELARQSYIQMFKSSGVASMIHDEPARISDVGNSSFTLVNKFNKTLGLLDEENFNQMEKYNWPQLKRYSIYGCFLAGPMLHGWYKWLDAVFQGTAVRVVVVKLFADQFILTPPLIIMFFISMSLMEGKSDILHECKGKFVQTFTTSCMYWIPVQFVNFMLVPPAFRVSFVSIAAFCWVNILCYFKSAPLPELHRSKEE